MTTTSYDRPASGAGLGARIILTLVGAAAIVAGSFMEWIDGVEGTKLDVHAFWSTSMGVTDTFVRTVGFVMIVLGLIAIVGLALGSGWLTRLAAVLVIVGVALVGIEVFRSAPDEHLQVGAWIALAGALVALVAGFLGARRLVVPPTRDETIVER
jgi:hypothetical protein